MIFQIIEASVLTQIEVCFTLAHFVCFGKLGNHKCYKPNFVMRFFVHIHCFLEGQSYKKYSILLTTQNCNTIFSCTNSAQAFSFFVNSFSFFLRRSRKSPLFACFAGVFLFFSIFSTFLFPFRKSRKKPPNFALSRQGLKKQKPPKRFFILYTGKTCVIQRTRQSLCPSGASFKNKIRKAVFLFFIQVKPA